MSGGRWQVNELSPENKALFRISKTPRIKNQGNAFDGSLRTAKSSSHNHDIRTHKFNTANLLNPVVHSTTAKELTPTESYSINGISLSEEQFNELTK
jgi:hypothetical protein